MLDFQAVKLVNAFPFGLQINLCDCWGHGGHLVIHYSLKASMTLAKSWSPGKGLIQGQQSGGNRWLCAYHSSSGGAHSGSCIHSFALRVTHTS